MKIVEHKLPDGPIVAYRLDGHYDHRGTPSQPGFLRGARILQSSLLTGEQSARLRGTIATANSFGGNGMRCFIPGLGFMIENGAEMVEILVCLKCYWAYFFRANTKTIEALSEKGYRQLSDLYIELFPGNAPSLP